MDMKLEEERGEERIELVVEISESERFRLRAICCGLTVKN